MVNSNYRRGRSKEYKVRDELKSEGCDITNRIAGSHSLFDVYGINIKKNIITFVQVKSSQYEANKARDELEKIGLLSKGYFVVFKVVVK
jgi:hypothetical protein